VKDPHEAHGGLQYLLQGAVNMEAGGSAGGLARYRQAGEGWPRFVDPVGKAGLPENEMDTPGDGQYLLIGQTKNLGHLPHGGPRLEGHLVGDHGGPAEAVLAEDVSQHIVPLVPGKIDIDVGEIGALGMEEALEVEVVGDGIDLGDEQAVADDGGGSGAPPDSKALS